MGRWELLLKVDRALGEPLSVQIARSIADEIRRGRLRPGSRLPGSRTLARSLDVSRNTVDAAYQELKAEGWIASATAHGSFVSDELPDPEPQAVVPGTPAGPGDRIGFDLPRRRASRWRAVEHDPPRTGARWDFGVPDVRLAPTRELVRAVRRVLRVRPERALQYDRYDRERVSPLQVALASMLSSTRGLAIEPDRLIVTRGSQMALYLIAQALCDPGDVVAVEHPGYAGAWDAFRSAGATIAPVAVDEAGIRVDDLERLVRRRRLRAVFITPHHQFPTTVTLSIGRRLELLRLARSARFAIVEDDYDHEFHYDGRPILPLASADDQGVVVYVGSLSKIFAPGLRIGYVVAPAPLGERIQDRRITVELQGDRVAELALAELFEDGEMQRHWRRSRRIYRARRDHLASLLGSELSGTLDFDVPSGGMAIWARVAPSVDVERWAARARARGLSFRTGAAFFLGGGAHPFVRLGFARLTERELEQAVRLMAKALPG